MRKRADGDVIHAGFRIVADVFQANASRGLHRDMPGMTSYTNNRLAHVFHFHVIEQDALCTVGQGFIQLRQRADLNFNRLLLSAILQGPLERCGYASGQRDMVILDQDAVRKVEAVVLAAASAYGVFIEHAQSGSSFACIQDPRLGSMDGVNVLTGRGGDSAEPL